MNITLSTINNSVRFDLLLETCFNKLTALQRVRVKVDPSTIPYASDLSECPSYEGYVLEENDGVVKVLMIQPNVGVETIPAASVEPVDDGCDSNILDELKRFILQHLNLQESDPLFDQILNCTSLDEVEIFLQQSGLGEGDILELYKEFIVL
jgi:hypothetical protein